MTRRREGQHQQFSRQQILHPPSVPTIKSSVQKKEWLMTLAPKSLSSRRTDDESDGGRERERRLIKSPVVQFEKDKNRER